MEIYGTIGPSCAQVPILEQMFQQGMTGMRLNLSHSSLIDSTEWMAHIHSAARKCGIHPQILIDLQGPELRVGKYISEIHLEEGETVILSADKENTVILPSCVFPYLTKGQEILLDDGKILLIVDHCEANEVSAKVIRGGFLKERKSVALPGVEILNPTLTSEDIDNIAEAKRFGITGVMLPFVRNASDIQNLRKALKNADAADIRIYAKIENMTGVRALDELIPHADCIVIARGDLGNSMPLWELPTVQKHISRICRQKKRSFMVVTQMLASMEASAVPTRAEVSDIYNAVIDGASAVMLTGETAAGRYPVEAMSYLVRTAEQAIREERE